MDQVPDTAQHFIECDTESCRNSSKFYCNNCHQRICDQCKQSHLEQNIGHEIVLYQERKRKVPSEKCRIHPTKNIDIYCTDCQDPLCSTCFVLHHRNHDTSDLETIYNDILQQCQKEVTDIWKTDIPKARDNVETFEEKRENVKKEIAIVRTSMKERADELKKAVDSILTDNNKKLDEIENSVLNEMVEQQKETEDYIKYLEKMIVDYESKMSSIKPTELIIFHKNISFAFLKMPNKAEPKLPIFTLGTINKEEIAKQLGEIELERFKLSSVTKVSEVTIQGQGTSHLSPLPPNRFWATEGSGNLIQSDMEGNILQKISTSMWYIIGNHTVTTEGELLYTDNNENTVYRVTSYMSITKFIETGSWVPVAIYSSPINGHILVGMTTNLDQKITRYNRKGRQLQDIQRDDKGQSLYKSVDYITQNINGDICVSDLKAKKVVVVTASGKYRFSYSGLHAQSGFRPHGICTNVLGHILVCNGYFTLNENCSAVHLLDINGQFLSLLLTPDHCPLCPCALCIDNQHNLWVGGWDSSTISVYTYLQETEK
ncbi:uncharacterized protein LOC133180621 [Saccostrea echinata]|uniref:uncharacterized protein LOC133180621 n=1 Tax=Saccostrea echinata TaxID=191078 RepID=UPI002A7F032C|nr:uncharacterized protein LOC133180621 [Saccostrea echinata]